MTHIQSLDDFKKNIKDVMTAFNKYSTYAQLSYLEIHNEAQGFFDNESGGSLLWEYPRDKTLKKEKGYQDYIQSAIKKTKKQAKPEINEGAKPDGEWECYLVQMNAAICEAVQKNPCVPQINLYGIPSHYTDKVIEIPGEYSKELEKMEGSPQIYVESFNRGSDYNPFVRKESPHLPYCRYTNRAYLLDKNVSMAHILSIQIKKTLPDEEKKD